MSRNKKLIEEGQRDGILKEYPFFDENGESLWKEKFSTLEKIEAERKKYNRRTWQREFLLKIVPEEGQEVKDEWIQYYDKIEEDKVVFQGTGVDLASSKKDTANYTAMVSGKLAIIDGQPKIYIMPHPINERLTPYETLETAREVSLRLGKGTVTSLWVEDVAYQVMAIEGMKRIGLPAQGVKVTSDKRARLRAVATYIEDGTVLFPKTGCEDLIIQLTGFGVEQHDDLVDAFTLLVHALMSFVAQQPKLTII